MFARRAQASVKEAMVSGAIRVLAGFGYSLRRSSELTHLADIHGSDKGFRRAAHAYTRIYEQLFRPLKHEPIVLLEIGLGGANAPSLQMWRRYFTKARIFGFDVEDFSQVRLDRCTVVQGDMACADDLDRLVEAIGGPIDVIIDDGSHAAEHQQIALGALFPQVRPGGLYIIEDLHWRPRPAEAARTDNTRDLLRRLQIDGTFPSAAVPEVQRRYIEANVTEVQLYDSMTSAQLDAFDALGVLIKT